MIRSDIRPREHEDAMLSEVIRSIQEAFDGIPMTSHLWVRGVVASGTAGTDFARISWGENMPGVVVLPGAPEPDAARIERIYRTTERTLDVGAVADRLNFVMRGSQIVLFEPSGLVAGASYDLLVRFLVGVS